MKRLFSLRSFRVMVSVVIFFLIAALISSGSSSVSRFLTSFLLTPFQRITTDAAKKTADALMPSKTYEELSEENLEQLLDLYDYNTPLFGGLLGTGDKMPIYPFVFGGIGVAAVLLLIIFGRRRKEEDAAK